jgi:shikimate kinase
MRIDHRTRPLLSAGAQGAGPQALFRSRVPDYARAADLIVANDRAPDETVEHLYEDLRHILDH